MEERANVLKLIKKDLASIYAPKAPPLVPLSDLTERKWCFSVPTICPDEKEKEKEKEKQKEDQKQLRIQERQGEAFITDFYHEFPIMKSFYSGPVGQKLAQ